MTSHANRASSGATAAVVKLPMSGMASMSGSCGRWPMWPAAKPANPRPPSSRSSIAWHGHELRVRLAVHVDELREEELDVVVADVRAHLSAEVGAAKGGADPAPPSALVAVTAGSYREMGCASCAGRPAHGTPLKRTYSRGAGNVAATPRPGMLRCGAHP